MDTQIDSIFGIHGAALLARSLRAEVLAANLANAGTPNYKARDIDFAQLLRAELGGGDIGLVRTDGRHLDAEVRHPRAEVTFRQPRRPSLDGNTVDTQIERAAFMKNAMQYQASLQFATLRIRTLQSAIRGE